MTHFVPILYVVLLCVCVAIMDGRSSSVCNEDKLGGTCAHHMWSYVARVAWATRIGSTSAWSVSYHSYVHAQVSVGENLVNRIFT